MAETSNKNPEEIAIPISPLTNEQSPQKGFQNNANEAKPTNHSPQSQEISNFSPSPRKLPLYPTPESPLRRRITSKEKTRFGEPSVPLDSQTLEILGGSPRFSNQQSFSERTPKASEASGRKEKQKDVGPDEREIYKREAVFHHYVLQTLSGRPVVELASNFSRSDSRGTQVSFRAHTGNHMENKVVDWEKIHQMKREKVPSWTMKLLVDVISNSGLSTMSGIFKQDVVEGGVELDDDEITCEEEAIATAVRIFYNVIGDKADINELFIDRGDLHRFMIWEEVDIVYPLFEVNEKKQIDLKAFSKWVVNVFKDRQALKHALNDNKTAVDEFNKLLNGLLIIIITVLWLLLTEVLTTKILLFFSSQLLVAVFVFGNTCKTVFEALIFVFVMHPFDVGDRCVIDGTLMIVEEMNILTTVFLKLDREKVYYPNALLSTKSIGNYYRSPDQGDTLEFAIDYRTPLPKIAELKERIKQYVEKTSHYWHPEHSMVVKEIENINKIKMAVYVTHTMNFQDIVEKSKRRTEFFLEMKSMFDDLEISYQLLPQEIHLTKTDHAPLMIIITTEASVFVRESCCQFLLKKNVVYFTHGLQTNVVVFIWIGLVLITWVVLFKHDSNSAPKMTAKTKRKLDFITWTIASCLIGSFLWLVKTTLIKILASSFHLNRFFNRIQEAVFHHYVLQTLSGKPVVELARKLSREDSQESRVSFMEHIGSHTENKVVDWEKLHQMKKEKVPSWTMQLLVDVVSNSGLSTMSGILNQNVVEGGVRLDDDEITCEEEAITTAVRIFYNVIGNEKNGLHLLSDMQDINQLYIDGADLHRFMIWEEVELIFPLFEVNENKQIDWKSFSKWVVQVFKDRQALKHALNDNKTAVDDLNKLLSGILIIIILVLWLLMTEVLTSKMLLFLSSQLLVAVFVFGNSCKTVFEAIIFVFVMHPFDVGDRCVVDGKLMIVEEMNILTTVFLKLDKEKVYYPNAVLATKPIGNYYRSPDQADTMEFGIDYKTPLPKIAELKDRIKKYVDQASHLWHPEHILVVKEIENVNKIKMVLVFNHTMNYQDIVERNRRRSEFVLQMKSIFDDLEISYHLLPQEIHLTKMAQNYLG
uniref:Mechanosensitive ion channel MscS domain-containing protein n=1 Tax=Chenopodium quinoa TaxID=63459 RepID=A0A803LYM7_CHEQI